MALQLGALRDALLDAGAKPDKADKAAEELAGYSSEFADLRGELSKGLGATGQEMARVRGELRLVEVLCGINIMLTAGVLWRLLAHS